MNWFPFMNREGQEEELLLSGRNYTEIAESSGVQVKEVRNRNNRIYKVDLLSTFRKRIAENGIPSRLKVTSDFGSWFSGFFDGEGTLLIYKEMHGSHCQRALKIQVSVRDDDSIVTSLIQRSLSCGRLDPSRAQRSQHKTNPQSSFRVQPVRDLAEIIVPLFEAHPLRSKKAREFEIWKGVVRLAYIDTAGGDIHRQYSDGYCSAFDEAYAQVRSIRTYTGTGVSSNGSIP